MGAEKNRHSILMGTNIVSYDRRAFIFSNVTGTFLHWDSNYKLLLSDVSFICCGAIYLKIDSPSFTFSHCGVFEYELYYYPVSIGSVT